MLGAGDTGFKIFDAGGALCSDEGGTNGDVFELGSFNDDNGSDGGAVVIAGCDSCEGTVVDSL